MTKEEQLKMLAEVISESADSFFSAKVNSTKEPEVFDTFEENDWVEEEPISADTPDNQSGQNTSNESFIPFEDGGTLSPAWEEPKKDVSFTMDDIHPNVVRPDAWNTDLRNQCQDIRKKDDLIHSWSDELVNALIPYATREFNEAYKKSYKNPKTERHSENKTAFKRDTCMVNGSPMEFTRVMQIPDWEMDLKDCMSNDDRAQNFDQVRKKITQCLYDYYGGFTRFNTIVVSEYQLIINGSCYMPKLSGATIEKFPFDTVDYIKNGCIAPFFDWGYLEKMKNLTMLCFDDMDFVMTYVASDLGIGRDFNPLDLFSICKSLKTLDIAGDVVTYPFDNPETSEEVKQSARNIKADAEYSSRFDRAYGVYTDKVCGTAGGVRKWTVNNLVNYANNRNNKNIFMYTGGILARSAVAAVAGTGELALRATGGIVKGITKLVKGAVNEARSKE